jgi:hypothetical protein
VQEHIEKKCKFSLSRIGCVSATRQARNIQVETINCDGALRELNGL